MGVDFTAILDHQLGGADLDRLPARLNIGWSLPDALQNWVNEYLKSGSKHWSWKLSSASSSAAEQLFNDGSVVLDGPDGFHATFHKRGVELAHLARWRSFAFEPALAVGLRQIVRKFGHALGSDLVIYLPDSAHPPSEATDLLFEGETVTKVESWLRWHVGTPVTSTTELQGSADSVNELAYIVERLNRSTEASARS